MEGRSGVGWKREDTQGSMWRARVGAEVCIHMVPSVVHGFTCGCMGGERRTEGEWGRIEGEEGGLGEKGASWGH
jgi:hypothetical protein